MKILYQINLYEKQLLLIQATFGPIGQVNDYLKQWHAKFNLKDLDQETRAILPLLSQRIQTLETCGVDPEILHRYSHYNHITWLDNSKKLNDFKSIFLLLINSGISICFLNSTAMLLYFYENIGMRPLYNPIDILVEKQNLEKTIQVFRNSGFIPKNLPHWKGCDLESDILLGKDICHYVHEISYVLDNIEINVHWYDIVDVPMLRFDLFNQPVSVLSVELQILNICKFKVRSIRNQNQFSWAIDTLYLLRQYETAINWDLLAKLAEQHHVTQSLRFFMEMLSKINPDILDKSSFECIRTIKIGRTEKMLSTLPKLHIPILKKIYHYLHIFWDSNSYSQSPVRNHTLKDFIHIYFRLPRNRSVIFFIIKKLIGWKKRKNKL